MTTKILHKLLSSDQWEICTEKTYYMSLNEIKLYTQTFKNIYYYTIIAYSENPAVKNIEMQIFSKQEAFLEEDKDKIPVITYFTPETDKINTIIKINKCTSKKKKYEIKLCVAYRSIKKENRENDKYNDLHSR